MLEARSWLADEHSARYSSTVNSRQPLCESVQMFLARGKVKEAEGEELPAGLLGGPASGKRGLSTEEQAESRSAVPRSLASICARRTRGEKKREWKWEFNALHFIRLC